MRIELLCKYGQFIAIDTDSWEVLKAAIKQLDKEIEREKLFWG